jgi:hypothetical protein
MALDHSCQVQRHPLSERGLDLYETPDVAVEALLRVERLQGGFRFMQGFGYIPPDLRDAPPTGRKPWD